ncbi:uncharacterized protein LOC122375073 [Amphibalanus amphitrite]|uniref:uncharacterized protein LOC122375073 n=1 Tax=Amphibalanus amphitrite TaxID=1232801 RepID=UPI001C9149F8|nr:uncharacterized protein LOC122375073 [Amphibalanus amphitrite]
MWKLLTVVLLVAAAQAKEQRSSSYDTADSYQQSSYYPAPEYDGYSKPGISLFNTDLEGWINLGLNVLILVLIGFVAFTISASVGSVIENADERHFNLGGMDVVGTIERLQKLYDSVVAKQA